MMLHTSDIEKGNDLREANHGTAHLLDVKKPKKKTRLTTIVSVSLEPDLAEEAKRVAGRYSMTVSALIRQLLITASAEGVRLTPRKQDESKVQ